MLEATKNNNNNNNKNPHPKTKKNTQQDSRRGTITIKSNPVPPGWIIYKLENNIKDVRPLW